MTKSFSQGAEAVLSRKKMFGKKVVLKQRVPKEYRHPSLDKKLRTERMSREARMLHAVKKIGINAPVLYGMYLPENTLYMEDISGKTLKEKLFSEKNESIRKKWLIELGKMIGTLHTHHFIHGDLTTSNVMVSPPTKETLEKITLIDFGLAAHSRKQEDKAVDLLNFKKTFLATHVDFPGGWDHFQHGYLKTGPAGKPVLKHVETVEKRIRYA